jgi:MFS family permease
MGRRGDQPNTVVGASPLLPISPSPPLVSIDAARLRNITGRQWKAGVAAWLGWLFDGLDMHIYTLIATPFVAQLLGNLDPKDALVGSRSSIIQAGFLVGWALGGGFFGRLGDRIGRSHALMATIGTYAAFTGLSFFAQAWWHLLLFRFLAALGIGGEWAVGSTLLAETWPRRWRPWLAAVLQSAVNCGVMIAMLAGLLLAHQPPRYLFLVGLAPALLVVWIRRAVPEPEVWRAAQKHSGPARPGIADLFRGEIRRTTVLTVLVCALALSAHWAFLFWCTQQLRNLPDLAGWSDAARTALAGKAMILLMVSSIFGNFLAAQVARRLGYRRTIALLCVGYFLAMSGAYGIPRHHQSLLGWLAAIGVCQGLFALFTMYLPPLFPTLLRTTGAGFCYNIGRLAAAAGTVFFGLFSLAGGDYRLNLLYAGFLFLPAAAVALRLPEPLEG